MSYKQGLQSEKEEGERYIRSIIIEGEKEESNRVIQGSSRHIMFILGCNDRERGL